MKLMIHLAHYISLSIYQRAIKQYAAASLNVACYYPLVNYFEIMVTGKSVICTMSDDQATLKAIDGKSALFVPDLKHKRTNNDSEMLLLK